ncbi:MAG: pyruvate dehydrogenase (acetyl-transferring) E1 component subunit alpha [Spirochaetales bacterium]|nr:pyruvate dehydrogenase (acetyl-transferring) E1 component subunit alpha [Spirochaetales bacterium]
MSSKKKYDTEFLHGLLQDMLLIRRFEEKAGQMYGLKKIGGFCHLYIGQEAIALGTIRALDLKRDYVLTSYRDHGHALACGMDPKSIMSELYGKITGCSRGKGGSMHMFDLEKHMFGGNGIVGAQIPIATGVAFKSAYDFKLGKTKDMGVTLCYFGDGAIHQGAFHESLNLAAIWKIPIIYIVENNHFGMGTAVKRVSAIEDFAIKAEGYGVEGRTIDGMNVLTVYESMKQIVDESRKTGKSFLVDLKTYRYKGHSMSDPAKYRTKEELESYKQQDPIIQLKSDMIESKLITEADFKALDDSIKKRVQESVEYAEESPEPPLHTMYEDIYAE